MLFGFIPCCHNRMSLSQIFLILKNFRNESLLFVVIVERWLRPFDVMKYSWLCFNSISVSDFHDGLFVTPHVSVRLAHFSMLFDLLFAWRLMELLLRISKIWSVDCLASWLVNYQILGLVSYLLNQRILSRLNIVFLIYGYLPPWYVWFFRVYFFLLKYFILNIVLFML